MAQEYWIVEADEYDAHPFTGLLEAMQKSDLLHMRSVFEQGFDLDSTPLPGVSPLLIHAACAGQPDVVELLLEHRANLAAQDPAYGGTALHWAAANNEYGLLSLLMDRHADPCCQSHAGATPLHVAAGQGHTACARSLLRNSADANAVDHQGCTPLHEACHAGHLTTVQLLLKSNADPDLRDRHQDTALQIAARRGQFSIVEELLRAGADTEQANAAGVTPLMSAAFFGHADVVSALLARGVNVRAADRIQRRSSLHWAALNDHLQVAESLVKALGEFDSLVDASGSSALDLAVEADAAQVLRLLQSV